MVKLGVARPQAKAVKQRAPKRRPMKKTTQSPKVFVLLLFKVWGFA